MIVLNNRQDLSDFTNSVQAKGLTLGFIPTMGALHKGHLSLIQKSIKDNQYTLVSIFINPTQFNSISDFEKYPKMINEDIKKLELLGCDAVYLPKVIDLYPNGLEKDLFDIGTFRNLMEDNSLPGYFEGICTVVRCLFFQIRPSNAYFGEKDFQQLQIIKKMVREESLPVNIISLPTFRASNGLALSTRNMQLSDHLKGSASFIYQSLLIAKEKIVEQKTPINEVIIEIKNLYHESDFKLDYFIIAGEEDLIPVELIKDNKNYRAFIAAHAGNIRLIDNLKL